ncbi:hypothetical protein BASA83_013650 [Batrachochytrium salamandrivorans]|nr:hypothetical protein BASA83_013650 [Batrachochytrium salamandrivorans]
MTSLEDIVASLTDRIRSLEIKNQALNKKSFPIVYMNQRQLFPTSLMALADTSEDSLTSWNWFSNFRINVMTLTARKIATLGTLLTDKALSWYNPYIEQPERYAYDLSSWSAFKERMKATFGEIIKSKYPRPSSVLSDKVANPVPFMLPSSAS